MRRMRAAARPLIAAAALLLLPSEGRAAARGSWTPIDASAGLAANRVQAVAAAPDGALWIGTDRGLSRFDGVDWTTWKAVDGLPGDDVQAVAVDTGGRVWVAAGAGFGRLDGGTWGRLGAPGARPGDRVSVAAAPDGSIWLGHAAGLLRFDAGASTLQVVPTPGNAGARALLADREGRLWVATASGVLLLEEGEWAEHGEGDGLPPGGARALAEGQDGTVWCAGERGLSSYDGAFWRANELPRGFGGEINAVVVDGEGRPWIGTTEGAGFFDGYDWHWFDAGSGLPSGTVLALAADANGSVWAGTERGLARHDITWAVPAASGEDSSPRAPVVRAADGTVWAAAERGLLALSGRFTDQVGPRDGLDARVLSLARGAEDRIWVGTDRGLFLLEDGSVEEHHEPKLVTVLVEIAPGARRSEKAVVCERYEGLMGAEVTALAADGKGVVWVGTATGLSRLEDGAWTCLDGEPGAPPRAPVRALAFGPDGGLLAGTDAGLFELAAGTWTRRGPSEGLPSSAVSAILADREGRTWVGTDRGLARREGDSWATYRTADGLVGDRVLALFEDGRGRLWVGTADGVSFLEGGLWGSFGERDGLVAPRVSSVAEADGWVWLASEEGVAVHRRDRSPPETAVRNPPAGPLTAALYTFEIAGADLETTPGAMRYSWRLDGGPWSPWSAEPRATLADLANGSHVFEARSLDRELNADPTPARVEFEVNTSLFDVEVVEALFAPIHAALWQFYATDPRWREAPLGRLRLRSRYDRPLRVKVSAWLPDLMDFPTDTVATVPGGGEEVEVPLRIELGEGALALAETAARQMRLTLQYAIAGERKESELTVPVTVIEPSAMSWEEPERIGLYVTHLDAAVERFARATVQAFGAEERTAIVYDNLIRAMALFDALGAAGLSYLPDPANPYGGIVPGRPALDVVRLPRETLRQGAGDCDDLAVLYAALLENIGIDTALVDVYDHVFVMFDTGLGSGGTRQLGDDPSLVHLDDRGRVWVPVETTLVGRSFSEAWRSAAETMGTHRFSVIAMKEAWERYRPLRPPGEALEIAPPAPDLVRPLLAEDLRLQERRLAGPEIRRLREREAAAPEDAGAANALGVLLARRGYLGQASARFERAIALVPAGNAAARTNLGNVRYEQGRYREAVAEYEEALRLRERPEVHVELALTWCELGRFDLAREHYRRAMEMAPGLAAAGPGGSAAPYAEAQGDGTGPQGAAGGR